MGIGRGCAVLLGLACLAPGAAEAGHAPGHVTIGNDRQILPAAIDINPGESVTWSWIGPDTEHSTTSPIDGNAPGAVTWDSDQGVATGDIDHPIGDTFVKEFAVAGTYFYGCRVHSDMRATIRATGTPTAKLTASSSAPFTGDTVDFSAAGSFDGTSGTIANYDWDIDGDNVFERDTDGTPTTSEAYTTAGNRTVRVRVTDLSGATAIAAVAVNVRSRLPVASFNVSATPREGQAVSFTSNSTDPDNDVLLLEWDLDNNSVFDDAIGQGPQRLYPVGPHTVGLRVTDNDGSSTTTRAFTVANQLPTAAFTATPATVLTGETVDFDGTASSDVTGALTTYEWDLDGDNIFELSGTDATPSRTYSTAGTFTTRLRVIDDEGGTSAVATRTVTVSAPPSNNPPPSGPAPSDPAPQQTPAPALPAPSVGGDAPPVLPPAATVAGASRQRALRQRGIIVTGGCDRACSLVVRGTANVPGASKVFRLRQVTRSLSAAGTARVKLALPRAAQRAIRAALRRKKRVTATITVAATDAAGTSTRTKRVQING